MGSDCHHGCECGPTDPATSPRYRRVLWVALWVNAAMFGGRNRLWSAQRLGVALLADAIDFLGDASNYALSLWALGAGFIWRSRVAAGKGVVMFGYGLFIFAKTGWDFVHGHPPEPVTMGAVGLLALAANVGVAALLYAYREGDANMRSVWLCSRNDALGNIAIVLAALAVWGTGAQWPDLLVALIMGSLAVSAGWQVMGRARKELREGRGQARLE